MPTRYTSSADTHAMVARIAPGILELLGDGIPRSRRALYQRPQAVTGLAHSRRVMEAMRSGMAMSVFQAWQQVSTIAW